MEGDKVYNIRKKLANGNEVLLTDGHSEVLEMKHINVAQKMVDVLNDNTDSGCTYRVLPVKNQTISDLYEPDYPLIHE